MVRPHDGDYMDDEPVLTTADKIRLDLTRCEYLAEALIWCEDSPQVQAALNDLAVTRERLQADLQRVTLNPNAVLVGRY